MNISLLRRVAATTLVTFTLTLCAPVVHAGAIGTERALAAGATAHVTLGATLAREDVRSMLVERGVDPALVDARVAALTDSEAQALQSRIDGLPAGGGVLGVLLTIFIVLLVTDLIGWTDVFPFTNKGSVGN